MVVAQAAMPVVNKLVPVPTVAALQEADVVPALPSNFTTREVGRWDVRVLLSMSLMTEREASPFGVMRQEQQEANRSSGENAYTFAQMLPF